MLLDRLLNLSITVAGISEILVELLGILEGLDPRVKAVYLDREFYDTYCLTLLAAHNYVYVIPIVKWGETI